MVTNIISAILKRLPGYEHLHQFYRLEHNFLEKTGWNKSASAKKPVDRQGNPIPWLTYSCINFLSQRVEKTFNIYEFGSGNSTLWFSKNCNSVVSVEHNEEWYNYIKGSLNAQSNVTYQFKDLESGAYANSINDFDQSFDLVLIDGRRRIDCSQNAVKKLTADGVIIWDNSDRERYIPGFEALQELGFKRLDFFGLSPGAKIGSLTSIFYRQENCLGI